MSIVTEITEIQNVPERMERLKPIIAKALKGNRMIDILCMPLEDWLVLRAMLGIGGSDVSTALGINEYKTPYELWKEKVGDTIDAKDNDWLWFGREAEELIAKGYSRITGRETLILFTYSLYSLSNTLLMSRTFSSCSCALSVSKSSNASSTIVSPSLSS